MPDNAFAVARLAALYDVAEVERADLAHYENIVDEFGARSVLDIGCGTGTLACRLAASGHDVIGVDPALASLDIARAKPSADGVQWVHGDAGVVAEQCSAGSIDMALMTGNVAQVFLGHDWDDTLAAVHQVLAPGGLFVFETRDPAYRAWEGWTRERSRTTLHSPTDGAVETWVDLVNVELPYVTFRWTYRFLRNGDELHSESTLRFRDRDELDRSLAHKGFNVREVRQAPDRPGKEFVYLCERPTSI